MNWITNTKNLIIGVLSGILICISVYMYSNGEEYRRISRATPLSVREKVGILPNGKELVRIIIPYKGRFHYVYVTDDSTTTIKRTFNGKTTNNESDTIIK